MNKKLLLTVTAAIAIGFSGVASAATFFGGEISIDGTNDVFTSTSITFDPGTANIGGDTGDLATALGTCTGCVTMNTNPLTSTSSGLVLTATNNGSTLTVDLTSISFSVTPGPAGQEDLTVIGYGTGSLTGFSDTPIVFDLTSQDPGGAYTFSATITATPLPSTWAMLIVSLVGLGMVAYRGSKKQARGISILDATAAAA